jgi:hypothetical protein
VTRLPGATGRVVVVRAGGRVVEVVTGAVVVLVVDGTAMLVLVDGDASEGLVAAAPAGRGAGEAAADEPTPAVVRMAMLTPTALTTAAARRVERGITFNLEQFDPENARPPPVWPKGTSA